MYITVSTDVEIDLSEIDTEDLVEELKSREDEGIPMDVERQIHSMYQMYRTNDPNLMETLRNFLQERTGRLLP